MQIDVLAFSTDMAVVDSIIKIETPAEKYHRLFPKTKELKCDHPACGKVYKSMKFLKNHVELDHTTAIFKCPISLKDH